MHVRSDLSLARFHAANLLDAYCRNDTPKVSEIGAEALIMRTFCADDPAEAERLELLGGIAAELRRFGSRGDEKELNPYVSLLLHLAYPDGTGSAFVYNN